MSRRSRPEDGATDDATDRATREPNDRATDDATDRAADQMTDRATDDATASDRPGDPPVIDHAAVPDSFVTTIRVERSAPERYRATQHDTDVEGYGATPHRAVVEFVRRAEASCFGRPTDDPARGARR